jgi:hypothetical protein
MVVVKKDGVFKVEGRSWQKALFSFLTLNKTLFFQVELMVS